MSERTDKLETSVLSCAYLDGGTIDLAIAAGVTHAHFRDPARAAQWAFLCELRLAGKPTASESVYTEALTSGRLDQLGGLQGILDASGGEATTAFAKQHIDALVTVHAQRQAWRLLAKQTEQLRDGTATMDSLRLAGEELARIATSQQSVRREIRDIADEALRDAKEALAGEKASRTLIYTGLPNFDKYATPIESHEYVIVGARTSHGKSSFMTQIAGHNLSLGRRVAYFTLETSDKSVLKQIAAQRTKINLRAFTQEAREKQDDYIACLEAAKKSKNLLIFDQDIRLTAIEARCRLLAQSFRPEVVLVDYAGIVAVDGASQYERITAISKAMIPLRKALGCALIVGCQLGRGVEKDEREPMRTDFRDSGSLEEDASRIICLYRHPGQPLDIDHYECSILQLKLRDGPTCKVDIKFHAPTTTFYE